MAARRKTKAAPKGSARPKRAAPKKPKSKSAPRRNATPAKPKTDEPDVVKSQRELGLRIGYSAHYTGQMVRGGGLDCKVSGGYSVSKALAWKQSREDIGAARRTQNSVMPKSAEIVEETLRWKRLQGDREELKLAKDKGLLIERAEAEEVITRRAHALRKAGEAMARRMAPVLAPMDSVRDCQIALEREWNSMLEAWSSAGKIA